jgi:hypothetical protein
MENPLCHCNVRVCVRVCVCVCVSDKKIRDKSATEWSGLFNRASSF